MTIYCMSCGMRIREGAKFCHSCGTPAEAQAPAAPSMRLEAPTERYYSPPPPAPLLSAPPASPRRGTLKIVLLTLAIVIALLSISLIGVAVFIKKAVVDRVKISPQQQISEADLGVPIYPGAMAQDGGGSVTITPPGGKVAIIGSATLTTEDDIDQVVEFYRERLGDQVKVIETRDGGKRTAVIQVAGGGARKIITATEEGEGRTKITIATIGARAVR